MIIHTIYDQWFYISAGSKWFFNFSQGLFLVGKFGKVGPPIEHPFSSVKPGCGLVGMVVPVQGWLLPPGELGGVMPLSPPPPLDPQISIDVMISPFSSVH